MALDPDTGKLKWHFQFTPHDLHDWDAEETPDAAGSGVARQAQEAWWCRPIATPSSMCWIARPASFCWVSRIERQTWAKGLDDRRKAGPCYSRIRNRLRKALRVCPGLAGGANWMAPSYNPDTKLFYFRSPRGMRRFLFRAAGVHVKGKPYLGKRVRGAQPMKRNGAFTESSGPVDWRDQVGFPLLTRAPWAGTLSTAGGLVFSGDEDGYLMAFDAQARARTCGSSIPATRLVSAPITYMVNGNRQYINDAERRSDP